VPSTQSSALRESYERMSGRVAANPGMDLATMRDMTASLSERQREPTGVTYEEVTAGSRSGLWARPLDAAADRVILYTHGGGYIGFTTDTSRKLAGHLAQSAGASALIVDYRLAPEHPFPAQLDDAVGAYSWLLEQGYEPARIAIAGESAGGNLAAATVLKLRDDGLPLPGALVLYSPWFDLLGELASFDTNAETDAFLSRGMSSFMAGMFLGKASATNPLANPRLADLSGFPPTYLTVGSAETLFDSVRAFAEKARGSGVDVTLEVGEGMQHAFQWMAGRAPEADDSIDATGDWLREKLESHE